MPTVTRKKKDATKFATPDVTTAQIVGFVPIIATLLNVFGVYHLSNEQVDALKAAVLASVGLFIGDGIIRHGRATGNASKS